MIASHTTMADVMRAATVVGLWHQNDTVPISYESVI